MAYDDGPRQLESPSMFLSLIISLFQELTAI
jgi:hypothetical protein